MIPVHYKVSVISLLMVLASHTLALYFLAQYKVTTNQAAPVLISASLISTQPAIADEPSPSQTPLQPPKKIPTPNAIPLPPKDNHSSHKGVTPVHEEKTDVPVKNTNIEEKPSSPVKTRLPEKNTEPVIIPPKKDAYAKDNPPPSYPKISRRLGEQGIVLLEILIIPDGTVKDIRLKKSSGYKRLDHAAMEAVRHWHYQPAYRGNAAINYWYEQPVRFRLN